MGLPFGRSTLGFYRTERKVNMPALQAPPTQCTLNVRALARAEQMPEGGTSAAWAPASP